jgi:UDP-N-acetylmuramoyl-tripeptide--D-alanyl-D-alanine ligase
MAQFTLQEILKVTNGTLLMGSGSGVYPSVSIDSRTVGKGELFIAIKGKNFDGHEFVPQAFMKGAGGAIISDKGLINKKLFQGSGSNLHTIIEVKDTLKSLHDIANYHRRRLKIPVVAITGSNGKSTTKEMSASVAGVRFNVLKNEGNLNNQFGLPLTLLKMNETHQVAILEMGMNEKGEIEKLSRIAEPDAGVITNIGRAHLEKLGSIENIRDAKGELIKGISENGTVILNSDDPLVMGLKNGFKGRVITFGINSPADITAVNIRKNEDIGHQFTLRVDGRDIVINLSYPGYHNIYNALSAAAVGKSLGIALNDIKNGIESFKPLPMRMEQFMIDGEITFINDAYNANPSSMEAAIRALSIADFPGEKFLVVGDMLELGDFSEEAHRHIGRLIASEPIDCLITVGAESKHIFSEAVLSGMSRGRAYHCENFDEVAFILDDELKPGDCVMLKGSRGMKMENVVERIIKLRKVS